jgi:hypothetical protein
MSSKIQDHGQGGASREAMMKNGSGDGGDACERRRDWDLGGVRCGTAAALGRTGDSRLLYSGATLDRTAAFGQTKRKSVERV